MSTDAVRAALEELVRSVEWNETKEPHNLTTLGRALRAARAALAQQEAQPEPEPSCDCTNPWAHDQCTKAPGCKIAAKLSAQPVPEPLTHMQIVLLWGHRSDGPSTVELVSFARAIERIVIERMRGKV